MAGDAGLLDGLRVLDMVGDRLELASRLLADMGADVVRIEPPDGVPSRRRPPFASDGSSLFHAVRNTNKRSVVVDLGETAGPPGEPGRAELWRLLEWADIWFEDDQDLLADCGFDAAAVRRHCPGLVVVSISDFGLTGPYRDYRATEAVHLALGTQLSRSGRPGREPLMPPRGMAYEASALQAAWAALVAYYSRLDTGVGDHLDFSVYEATIEVMDPALGTVGTATVGAQAGSKESVGADLERGRPTRNNYPIFPCTDGYVRLTILSPRQWRSMRAWIGNPAEFDDPKFDAIVQRYEARDELYDRYAALFKDMSKHEAAAEGQRRGIAISAVLSIAEVLAEEHFAQRGVFVDAEVSPGVVARIPSGFFEVDGKRIGYRRRAPMIGEHTNEVLAELNVTGPAAGSSPVAGPVRDSDGSGPRRRPLAGLRVIDFGIYIFGSEVGRLFADMGADVIKVENRAFPDGTRTARPGPMSVTFAVGHRNERSLGVNLRSPDGVEIVKRLAAESHVIVSNFKPGTLESLGLGYETLAEVNRSLVWMSGSGFGHTGPWSSWLGYGPLVRSASGLTSMWRYPDDPASFSDITTIYPDHFSGRVAAIAVISGLIRARRTGAGADIRVSQAETAINHHGDLFAHESVAPGSGSPAGNVSDSGAPWNVYPCLGDDEWCVITVASDAEWANFVRVLGHPAWADDARFSTARDRLQNRDELDQVVRSWTQARSPEVVMTALQQGGVAAAAMRRTSELVSDPQLRFREFVVRLDQPGIDWPVPMENRPFNSLGIADPELRPAPFQGQHTIEVCQSVLGLSLSSVEDLLAAGVLESLDDVGRRILEGGDQDSS